MRPPARAIVLPVPSAGEHGVFVPSARQTDRKKFLLGQQRSSSEVMQVTDATKTKKETIYSKIKAERISSKVDRDSLPKISVASLDRIGADVLFFEEGAVDIDALRAELSPDFVVGSDVFLSFPQSEAWSAGAAKPVAFGSRYELSNVLEAHRSTEAGNSNRRLRGHNVLVGVLDSGVDSDHDEFRRRRGDQCVNHAFVGSDDWNRGVVEGRGFDLGGHGTHVASIIGGASGVAPNCLLCAASSSPYTDNRSRLVMFAIGLDWIFGKFTEKSNYDRKAILNLSVGFPALSGSDHSAGDLKVFQGLIRSVIDLGVLVVTSVGNTAGSCTTPADLDGVLAVGAVDDSDKLAHFSGYASAPSQKPDILGFGVNVVGAARRPASGDSLYDRRSGTSQAAAYISGLAALYWQKFPSLTAEDIKRALKETAYPPVANPDPVHVGWGIGTWSSKWAP